MDSSDRLVEVFAFIDAYGGPREMAEADMTLASGDALTVRAGGGRGVSVPAAPPFTAYEVLIDHEPPRFWHRYTDADGLVYAKVPRLLVAHHIIRRGGIKDVDLTSKVVPLVGFPIRTFEGLAEAFTALTGQHIDPTAFSPA